MGDLFTGLLGVLVGFILAAFGFFVGPVIGGLQGGCIMLAGLAVVFLSVRLIDLAGE